MSNINNIQKNFIMIGRGKGILLQILIPHWLEIRDSIATNEKDLALLELQILLPIMINLQGYS